MRLAEGEACYLDPAHESVPLDAEQGRQALVRQVWYGPLAFLLTPESQLPIAVLSVVIMLCAAFTSTLWVGLSLFLGPPLIALLIRIFLPALLGSRTPRGTSAHALLPLPTDLPLRGRVVAKGVLSAPLSGRECVGFALALGAAEFSFGDVFLRDAQVAELRIELENGRHIDLPAGPMRLDFSELEPVLEKDAARRYLRDISAALVAESKRPPVPYDQVWEGILRDGDRVWIIGEVTSGAVSYRESGMAMSFVNQPHLRVVAPNDPTD